MIETHEPDRNHSRCRDALSGRLPRLFARLERYVGDVADVMRDALAELEEDRVLLEKSADEIERLRSILRAWKDAQDERDAVALVGAQIDRDIALNIHQREDT